MENTDKYSENDEHGTISTAEVNALLAEDAAGEDGDAEAHKLSKGFEKIMASMSEHVMAAVAAAVSSLGPPFKRLGEESNPNSQPKKKQKTRNESTVDDDRHTGDESDVSSYSDSAELQAILAPKAVEEQPTTSTTESSDLLSQIASDFTDGEDTSSAVTEKLAEIINTRFSGPLKEEKLKEKLGQYLRPENCEKLAVPRVNPEIWTTLNRSATRQDLQTASIQKAIVKAGTALTQLAETLLTTSSGSAGPDISKMLTLNTDALALLGHATHQLSMHRRLGIKPFLNKEYSILCSPQGPVTEFLFGDELQTRLNNIKASNKIGHTVSSDSPRQPAKGREPWKNRSKSSFLGRRGGRQDRPPYRQKQWKPKTKQ